MEMLRYSANPEKGRTQGASAAFNQVSLLAKGQTSPLISAAVQFLRLSAQRNLVTMEANAAGGEWRTVCTGDVKR